MKFTGAECVFCKKKFEENDDVVVCPVCGSPHHRECWSRLGKCANSDLHKENYIWTLPEQLKQKEEPPVQNRANPEAPDFHFKNGENTVVCPHCGAVNYGNDAYCFRCKAPLENGGNNGNFQQQYEQRTENAHPDDRAFRQNLKALGGLTPDALVSGIPAQELSDYIGGGNPGRIIRMLAAMERYGRKISLSFAAFIFGPIWFFYRKMFKEGLLYIAVFLVLSFSASALSASTQPVQNYYREVARITMEYRFGEMSNDEFLRQSDEAQAMLDSSVFSGADKVKNISSLVLSSAVWLLVFIMALRAFVIYEKKMKKDIFRIRGECSDFYTYERRLSEQGGTSVGGAVIGVLLMFFAKMISTLPYMAIIFDALIP